MLGYLIVALVLLVAGLVPMVWYLRYENPGPGWAAVLGTVVSIGGMALAVYTVVHQTGIDEATLAANVHSKYGVTVVEHDAFAAPEELPYLVRTEDGTDVRCRIDGTFTDPVVVCTVPLEELPLS